MSILVAAILDFKMAAIKKYKYDNILNSVRVFDSISVPIYVF